MTLLAAGGTAGQTSNQQDLVIGIRQPIATSRDRAMIGFFVNTLASACDSPGSHRGRSAEVKLQHWPRSTSGFPFGRFELAQPYAVSPIVRSSRVMFAWQNNDRETPNYRTETIPLGPHRNRIAKFDLTLSLEEARLELVEGHRVRQ